MAHQGYDKVRSNKAALLIYKHNPVCIAVVDYANIAASLCNKRLKRLNILCHKGVRVMIWEGTIYCIIDICYILTLRNKILYY